MKPELWLMAATLFALIAGANAGLQSGMGGSSEGPFVPNTVEEEIVSFDGGSPVVIFPHEGDSVSHGYSGQPLAFQEGTKAARFVGSSAASITIDLGLHPGLRGPTRLTSRPGRRGISIVFSSDVSDFPSVVVEAAIVDHLSIVSHHTNGTIQLVSSHHFPVSHLVVDAGFDDSVVVVLSSLDHLDSLSLTAARLDVRAALAGCTSQNTPSMPILVTGPCTCAGTVPLQLIGSSVTITSLVETVDGDLTISATTLGVSISSSGIAQTLGSGALIISGFSVTGSPAVDISGQVSASADLAITATCPQGVAMVVSGGISASALTVGVPDFSVTTFSVDSAASMRVLPGASISVVGYNSADIDTETAITVVGLACSSLSYRGSLTVVSTVMTISATCDMSTPVNSRAVVFGEISDVVNVAVINGALTIDAILEGQPTTSEVARGFESGSLATFQLNNGALTISASADALTNRFSLARLGGTVNGVGADSLTISATAVDGFSSSLVQVDATINNVDVVAITAIPTATATSNWSGVSLNAPGTCGTLTVSATSADAPAIITMTSWTADTAISLNGVRVTNTISGPAILLDSATLLSTPGTLDVTGTTTTSPAVTGDFGIQLFFATLQFGTLDLSATVNGVGNTCFGIRSQGATFTASSSGPQSITASIPNGGQNLVGIYFGRAHLFSSSVSVTPFTLTSTVVGDGVAIQFTPDAGNTDITVQNSQLTLLGRLTNSLTPGFAILVDVGANFLGSNSGLSVNGDCLIGCTAACAGVSFAGTASCSSCSLPTQFDGEARLAADAVSITGNINDGGGSCIFGGTAVNGGGITFGATSSIDCSGASTATVTGTTYGIDFEGIMQLSGSFICMATGGSEPGIIFSPVSFSGLGSSLEFHGTSTGTATAGLELEALADFSGFTSVVLSGDLTSTSSAFVTGIEFPSGVWNTFSSFQMVSFIGSVTAPASPGVTGMDLTSLIFTIPNGASGVMLQIAGTIEAPILPTTYHAAVVLPTITVDGQDASISVTSQVNGATSVFTGIVAHMDITSSASPPPDVSLTVTLLSSSSLFVSRGISVGGSHTGLGAVSYNVVATSTTGTCDGIVALSATFEATSLSLTSDSAGNGDAINLTTTTVTLSGLFFLSGTANAGLSGITDGSGLADGVRLTGCMVFADIVTMNGLITDAFSVLPSSGNVGVYIDTTTFTISGFTPSSIVGLGAGGGSACWGAAFFDSTVLLNGPAGFALEGRSAASTDVNNHGLVLSGFLQFDDQQDAGGIFLLTGTAGQILGPVLSPSHGILAAAIVTVPRGTLQMDGVTAGGTDDCVGVNLQGQYFVGISGGATPVSLVVTGQGGDGARSHGISSGAPVNMLGPSPSVVMTGTALQGAISGSDGKGVTLFDRFSSQQPATVTVTGVSGEGANSQYGIEYFGALFPGSDNVQLFFDGTSNGVGGSMNHGVFIHGELVIGQPFGVTGVSGSGISSHGVSFSPSTVFGTGVLSPIAVTISGTSGSSAMSAGVLLSSTGVWDFTGMDVTFDISSSIGGVQIEPILLISNGGLVISGTSGGVTRPGIALSGCTFTLGAAATITGQADANLTGVQITNLNIQAPTLVIAGTAPSGGSGVTLDGTILLSTTTATITGYSNDVSVRAFTMGTGVLSALVGSVAVIGDGTLNPTDGVLWSGSSVSGPVSLSGDGTNSGISFSGGSPVGVSNGLFSVIGTGGNIGIALVNDFVVTEADLSFSGTVPAAGSGVSTLSPGAISCSTQPCTLFLTGTGSVGVNLLKDIAGFSDVTIDGSGLAGGTGVVLQASLAAPAQVFGSSSTPFNDITINVPFSSPGSGDLTFIGETRFLGSGTVFGDKVAGNVDFLEPFACNNIALLFSGAYDAEFSGATMISSVVQFMQSGVMDWTGASFILSATSVDVNAQTICTASTVTLTNAAQLAWNDQLTLPTPPYSIPTSFDGSGSTTAFNGAVGGFVVLSGSNTYAFASSLVVDSFVAGPATTVELSGSMATAQLQMVISGSLVLSQATPTVVQLHVSAGPLSLEGTTEQSSGDIALNLSSSGVMMLDGVFSYVGPTSVVQADPVHLGGTWPMGHDLRVESFQTAFISSLAQLPLLAMLDGSTLEMGTVIGDTSCFASVGALTLTGATVAFDLNQPGNCVLADSLAVTGNLLIESGGLGQSSRNLIPPTILLRPTSLFVASTAIFELFDVGGTTTGEFTNLQEGDSVNIAGTVLNATYVYGAGNSIALIGDLPAGMEDNYSTSTSFLNVPAPGVLENDRSSPDPSLTVVLSSPATGGSVVLQPDGSFSYLTNGFAGTAMFTYQLVDGPQLSQPIPVFITVIFIPPSSSPSITPTVTPSITLSRTSTASVSMSRTGSLSITGTTTPSTSFGSPSTTPSLTSSLTPSRLPSTALEAPPPPGSSPAPSTTPTAGASGSRQPSPSVDGGSNFNFDDGDIGVIVQPVSTDTTSPVTVTDSNGDEVATVLIPPSYDGTLVVTGAGPDVVTVSEVSSAVLDVTVFDSSGQPVTQFDEDVEICFSTSQFGSDDVCLGFYTEAGTWKCEDYCLEESNGMLCGGSDHLTNFALLLSGDAGSSSRCGSSSQDYLIIYLSVAFVGAAVCVVIIAIVVVEVRVRLGTKKTSDRLTRNLKNQNSMETSSNGSSYGFVEPTFEE